MRYLKKNGIKFPYTDFNIRNTLMFYFFMTFSCGSLAGCSAFYTRAAE